MLYSGIRWRDTAQRRYFVNRANLLASQLLGRFPKAPLLFFPAQVVLPPQVSSTTPNRFSLDR